MIKYWNGTGDPEFHPADQFKMKQQKEKKKTQMSNNQIQVKSEPL